MIEKSVIYNFFRDHFWIADIIFGFLGIVVLHLLLKVFVAVIKSKSIIKKYSWKEKIDYFLLKPAHLLIWTLGIVYIIKVIADKFGLEMILHYIYPIRNAFVIALITWSILRWKRSFESFLIKKRYNKKVDSSTVDFIGKLASIVIVFISLLIILQVLGVDIVPLIAFGGVGAAAIGFAAKDVIANFFGGLMVYFTKPFKQGDLVEIPKEDITGIIEHIGWYLTCIRNFEKCPIYIPNSIFSTSQIRNASRRTHRRIEEKIGIRYQDFQKIGGILEKIREMIKEDESIDNNQSNLIYFNNYKEYSLEIYIRVYTHQCALSSFFEIKQRILMGVNEIIQANEADIPFPTNTIKLQ